jgi:hypothetical protein
MPVLLRFNDFEIREVLPGIFSDHIAVFRVIVFQNRLNVRLAALAGISNSNCQYSAAGIGDRNNVFQNFEGLPRIGWNKLFFELYRL